MFQKKNSNRMQVRGLHLVAEEESIEEFLVVYR